MASHRYQQIPTTEEISLPEYTPTPVQSQTLSQSQSQPRIPEGEYNPNDQYFSGLPTSAPPSFYSTQDVTPQVVKNPVEVTSQVQTQTQTQVDHDGVSVWAPSEFESGGATSSIEDAMVRLMDRVEVLEGRLGVDLESGAQKEYTSPLAREKWKREEVMVTAFVVWLCVTITWMLVK